MVKNGYFISSFPPAINLPLKWTDQIDGYRVGDLSHNEMYRQAIRVKKTVFNLVGKDLETETKDVLTVIYPMYIGRALWGAIFWELELRYELDSFIRPNTYMHFHYPYFGVFAP